MADLYVARQPIFDRNLSVVGYDLLYRSGAATTVADVTDDEVATSRVVYNTLVELDTSSAGRIWSRTASSPPTGWPCCSS